MNSKKEILITICIVLLSFIIRVYRLDVPHDWSFDEVYHALSAEAYALNDPRGYEWWNASPKDLAYEWLHPPIGKLLMAASIKIFAKPYIPISKSAPVDGNTSFAWRFSQTVFGALTVWLLIRVGKRMLGNFWIGCVAGILYAFDGLSFVQSRTGMNDIFIAFFVLLAFYRLYIFLDEYSGYVFAGPAAFDQVKCCLNGSCPASSPKKTHKGTPSLGSPYACHPLSHHPLINLLLLGIATGLAASTKWTGFYAVGICFIWGVFQVIRKKDWEILPHTILLLAGVPVLVYLLSYGQWWLQGHTWEQFVELHKQIWWYQTGLKATHGYQSTALSWPILYRPVWYYVKYQDVVKDGVKQLYIGNIYTMGNPIIWWAGLLSILYLVYSIVGKIYFVISNKVRNLGTKYPNGNILRFTRFLANDIKLARNDNMLPLLIILIGYFGMFLPWVFSPRIMFLYHYLPAVPFLCLGLAYGLDRIRRIGPIDYLGGVSGKHLVTFYLVIVIIIFIYFYPHWSGLLVPKTWADQYYWLPSWR